MADVAIGKQVVAPTSQTVIKNLDHGQVREIMNQRGTADVDMVMAEAADVIEDSIADEITGVADILVVDIVIHQE